MAHIYQPQVTRDGHLNGFPGTGGYATGALLFQFNGRFCANYSGGQMGTSTAIFNFPTANLTIAVGMNIQSRRVLAYVQRLYQLLMNEPLFASVYTGDRVGDDYVTAMQNIFENGLSYYEIQRRPLAASAAEAAAAFAYFNKYVNAEALHANRAEVLKKINEAQQPFVGQPFTKLGSYMAAKLGDRRGVRSLENYHAAGAISFFNDYIEMYKKESGYPKELQFNEGFEQTVTRWERSWRKTNNAYVRALSITPETDFDVAARRLRETFKGAEVYPDLGLNSNNTDAGGLNFFNTVQQLLLKGELAKAASAGQLAVELYPQSELANTALALVKISSGDKAQALMLLKEAAAINPEGMASADNLGNLAQNWAAADNADGALQVLNLAAELYPRAANLYEMTGELYLRKGQKGKAAEFYRTALQLDPNSKNARSALENLAHE
jgi:tetratricopeptide (TPR) repeat protein